MSLWTPTELSVKMHPAEPMADTSEGRNWLLLLLPVVVAACELVAGVEERSETNRTRLDAGPIDSGPSEAGAPEAAGLDADALESSAPVEAGCSARPPDRPPPEDGGPGDGGDAQSEEAGIVDPKIVFAMDSFSFGAETSSGVDPKVGFDIDGVLSSCTDPATEPPSKCRAPEFSDKKRARCDGECGRDLGGNNVLADPLTSLVLNASSVQKKMLSGVGGLLVSIDNYNETPNDDSVVVMEYITAGTPLLGDGGHIPPQWSGIDIWTVVDGFATKKDGVYQSLLSTSDAYVADGVLVAKFDKFFLNFSTNADSVLLLEMTRTLLTAELHVVNGNYELVKGSIGGVASASSLLTMLQSVETKGTSNPHLCPGTFGYDQAKPLICSSVDMASDPLLESPDRACDGLAFGLTFSGKPALLDFNLTSIPLAKSGCGDGGPPPTPNCD